MTVNVILQARMSSTRLPGKVLKPILGKAMLTHQIERLKEAKLIDKIIVATSDDASDNDIEVLCKSIKIKCFRGSLHDVLARYYHASISYPSDHIVRITGDCPVIDPEIVDKVISLHLTTKADYTSNCTHPTFPDGLDTEVFTFSALEQAFKNATSPEEREHVTPYLYHENTKNVCRELRHPDNLSHLRWTVDQPEDFTLIETIYKNLYPKNPKFRFCDILTLINTQPQLSEINHQYVLEPQPLKPINKG
ncbi:NTP transferase domain-containing protein [Colwelliaceae bacterium 6441]